MKRLLAALTIVVSSGALAGYSYVDPEGVRLRLLDAPCAVPEAAPQFIQHGVPPQIAVTANAAEIVDGDKVIPACYLVHPKGIVYAVAPAIGEGIMTLPVDAFSLETGV